MIIKEISVTAPFSFHKTLFSHGWIDLAPFCYDESMGTLTYKLNLAGNSVLLKFSSPDDKLLTVEADTEQSEMICTEIDRIARRMFRLDEDLSEFYNLASETKDFKWVYAMGAGRLFRTASLWEDMVKMLCTTNCTWNLTRIMVRNLVEELGDGCFPEPRLIAGKAEMYLREQIKMGYRAPYLMELSQRFVEQEIDIAAFETQGYDCETAYKQIRKIKGFGHYAASNLLKLLGYYDYFGSDSWSLKKFSAKHLNNAACTEKDITVYYEKFARWQGLFFWMDMTADWHVQDESSV